MRRQRGRWNLIRSGLALALALDALAAPAAAQSDADEPFYEPGIKYLAHTKPWVQWVLGAGFAVGCLLIAFKNPHRSHLD